MSAELLRALLSLPWVDEAYCEDDLCCVALASDWYFNRSGLLGWFNEDSLGYGFGRFASSDDALTACRRNNVRYGAPFYRLIQRDDGRVRGAGARVYGGAPVSLAVDLGGIARTRLGVVGGEAELFDGQYRPLPSFNKLRLWDHSDHGARSVFDCWRGSWMAEGARRRWYAARLLEWAVQRFAYDDHLGDDYGAAGDVWIGVAGPYSLPNLEGGRTVIDECSAVCFSGASDRDTRYVLRRYGVRRVVKLCGWWLRRCCSAGNALELLHSTYALEGLGEWSV